MDTQPWNAVSADSQTHKTMTQPYIYYLNLLKHLHKFESCLNLWRYDKCLRKKTYVIYGILFLDNFFDLFYTFVLYTQLWFWKQGNELNIKQKLCSIKVHFC